jgi:hypothetical protein
MERLLARLERRFGRYAIANLPVVIAGGMLCVFVFSLLRPDFVNMLTLDLERVRRGEVWRLFTYLFIPEARSPIWALLSIYVAYWIAAGVEREWGAFKFDVFYLLGMVGTTIAAAIAGGAAGNVYLNLSLFLAFATLFPDMQIYLFFIIPVRVKWLGMLSAAFVVLTLVTGNGLTRAAVVASLLNYLLFFGEHWIGVLRGRNLRVRQAARRASNRPPPDLGLGQRTCALCGAREADGADIRVCSCEKCGGPRNLCLEHARNH